jgi:BirA family biotin operon repressor/biotin-[acetyl-CoA-carboxylase] ligase
VSSNRNSKSPLTSEKVLKGLSTKVFGRVLYCFPKVTSTNDVILQLAQGGAPEGTVVAAEVQTQGRGRQGRRWVLSEGKALAFSVLLHPHLHPDEVSEITLAAAVAVAKSLEDYRFRPRIKWPNDLLLSGLKVCGILTEMGPKKDKMLSAVLGIGVNLNQSARDFPAGLRKTATSLYRASGRKVDRVRFFQRLLVHLEETYRWVSERRFSKVLSEWRKRSDTLGQQVKVTQGYHHFYGQAVDLDEKGALLVRSDWGMTERVTSGDVETLKLWRKNGKA